MVESAGPRLGTESPQALKVAATPAATMARRKMSRICKKIPLVKKTGALPRSAWHRKKKSKSTGKSSVSGETVSLPLALQGRGHHRNLRQRHLLHLASQHQCIGIGLIQ
jgi:hypothetical protein